MAGDLYVGMVFGGCVAALWSFLMARYVAGPRAKTLMVGTLRGDTAQDKLIVAEIRENLVRPEIQNAIEAMPIPKLDLVPIMAKMDRIEESIPDFDGDALMARLDQLEQGLPDMVGTHISMAIKGVQATEGKAIAKYVEELGIEGITEEAKEAAVERLTTKQRLAYQLMTMKVSPKLKREHPVSTMVFEQSRGLVAQQLIESDSQVSYDNSGPARSGTFRPGYNP